MYWNLGLQVGSVEVDITFKRQSLDQWGGLGRALSLPGFLFCDVQHRTLARSSTVVFELSASETGSEKISRFTL